MHDKQTVKKQMDSLFSLEGQQQKPSTQVLHHFCVSGNSEISQLFIYIISVQLSFFVSCKEEMPQLTLNVNHMPWKETSDDQGSFQCDCQSCSRVFSVMQLFFYRISFKLHLIIIWCDSVKYLASS